VPIVNDYGYVGKGDGPVLPPGRWRGSGGKTTPLNLNPQGRTTKRRMKMEKQGM
jgi:anti-sigma factor ChrR (cupin superfamily)